MKLVIEVQGNTASDLSQALEEVKRLVSDGYEAGADSNDTGSYQFYVTNIEEEEEEDDISDR